MAFVAAAAGVSLLTRHPAVEPPAVIVPQWTDDADAASRSLNGFAVDMYRQLASESTDGNLFFSPFSIQTALAMTYQGARGETAAEMARVLRFESTDARLHAGIKTLTDTMLAEARQGDCQLSAANRLWGQTGFHFLQEFLALNKSQYGAGMRLVDFEGATEAARMAINDWTAEETHGKVRDLLRDGDVDIWTRLVLTNAIYFQGRWHSPFSPKDTKDGDFKLIAGGTVRVPLMHQKGNFSLKHDQNADVIRLLYEGRNLAMSIVLPNEAAGLPALERDMTTDGIIDMLNMDVLNPFSVSEVILTMPKMSVSQHFDLETSLQSMGMKKAFDSETADFSGISADQRLSISKVIHGSFIDVNEKGTEAAAATAVSMGWGSPPEPVEFIADRPFIFVLQDTRHGTILFMGRVMNPKT